MRHAFQLFCIFLLAACQAAVQPAPSPLPPTPLPTRTPAPTSTPYPTPTRAPTWTPDLAVTPTIDLFFYRYTVNGLRLRAYGGGKLEFTEKTADNAAYNQYIFRYPSDGLTIYGYANVPHGDGPYSVIIMLHGAGDPQNYTIFEQDTEYASLLAEKGYIVLHPNYRNFAPSSAGENLFLAGDAIDVLNLVALVKEGAGQTWNNLRTAKPGRIGLWAFSMGGAVAWRVLVVSPDITAAFFYSPMSGDDLRNGQFLAEHGDQEAQKDLELPTYISASTSPNTAFQNITAAVDIHHGSVDSLIPVSWSQETCTQLEALKKTVNCYFYEGADHSFSGNTGLKFEMRMVNFFNKYFKNAAPTVTPTP